MPRISAASVADHRAQQRQALLVAARELLEEGDASAVTFAAVAARAGLARNSLYKYFADRGALLAEVVREVTPRWTARIDAELAQAPDARGRVAAYVRAQCALAHEGEHRVARALAEDGDAVVLRAGAAEAHRAILEPLVATLRDLGDDTPLRTALLLQGLVNAAVTALDAGEPYPDVTERAVAMALGALDAAVSG
ncbi:TetR/AcrR family transcriptional regulator [Streptacidiphilus jiangxiensis]|nr:TetR family transcriptional regulator [Streptacidiphilus jiangxiensis]